jgi:hypothetical protein
VSSGEKADGGGYVGATCRAASDMGYRYGIPLVRCGASHFIPLLPLGETRARAASYGGRYDALTHTAKLQDRAR